MAGAALGAALVSLVAPAVGRAGEQPAPVRPPTAQFVAAPAAMTQTSLTPVSPGAIDVLLGIKHVGPSPTPAAAEPEHDLADAPNLGSVVTAPVDPTSVLASGFVRPVEGPITSRFGPRFHPILQVWKLHTGTDIGAACGTPVKAAKDGSVTSAGIAGGDGNRVVLDHGQGLATTYNHLSSYAAAVGMQVRQGQVIGYVGTTGLSTGCHLHFEVMVNGVLVDSGPYLDLAPAPSVTLPPAVAATSGAAAPVAAAAAPAPAPAAQAPAAQAPAVPPAPAPAPPPPAPAPPAPAPPSPAPPSSPTPTTPTTSCPPPDGTPSPAPGSGASCPSQGAASSSTALKSSKSASTSGTLSTSSTDSTSRTSVAGVGTQ